MATQLSIGDIVLVVGDLAGGARYEVAKLRNDEAKVLDIVHGWYGGWVRVAELERVRESRKEVMDEYIARHGSHAP